MTKILDRVVKRASWWLYARGLHPGMSDEERARIRLYRQFVRKGDLCFDIGANMGNRSEVLLALGAKVVAVEPQAKCADHLRRRFANHLRMSVVQAAVGQREGDAELMVNQDHTLSTLSREWLKAVGTSGRFGPTRWDRREKVPVTTLDSLIGRYGCPTFCKIDIEGYEVEAVSGLSRPIATISFEFAPEFIAHTVQVIERLTKLGNPSFNYSLGETMVLQWSEWQDSRTTCEALQGLPNRSVFGDVYARFGAR